MRSDVTNQRGRQPQIVRSLKKMLKNLTCQMWFRSHLKKCKEKIVSHREVNETAIPNRDIKEI